MKFAMSGTPITAALTTGPGLWTPSTSSRPPHLLTIWLRPPTSDHSVPDPALWSLWSQAPTPPLVLDRYPELSFAGE